jgi:hypothetical protein
MADPSPSTVLGEALYAALLAPSILVLLVRRGVIPREEAIALVDNAMLALERRQAVLEGADAAAVAHTRSRLESLLRRLEAKRDPNGSQPR